MKAIYSDDKDCWEFASDDIEFIIQKKIESDESVSEQITVFKGVLKPLKLTDLYSVDNLLASVDDIYADSSPFCDDRDYKRLSHVVTDERKSELKELLQSWADKYNLNPDWDTVVDIEPVIINVNS